MKGSRAFPSLGLAIILCTLLMTACGGKTPANGPSALNISTPGTLPVGAEGDGYSQSMQAYGGVPPYTWSLDSGALPPNFTFNSSGVLSGTPPTGSAGTYNFTIRVTDSQTPTKAYQIGNMTLAINTPLSFPSSNLSNAIIALPYSSAVSASGGINCGTTPPCYTYTLAPGSASLPAGLTLNSDGTITGTATGPIGTYPFTVQVTDNYPTTATANFSITVVGKIQGNYAFSFNGYNNGQPFYMAGSFCADGNGIINPASSIACPAGVTFVLDRNGSDAIGAVTNAPFTGTYTIDNSTNLGTMTLDIPGLGTYNYNLAISVVSDTRFIQSDPNIYGSGVIRPTTSLTLPTGSSNCGGYSFGFFGTDPAGQRLAGAGSFVPDTSGNLKGVEDTNDNGTPSGKTTLTGTISAPVPGSPRGTLTLNAGSTTVDYAIYVVVPSTSPIPQLIAVQTDPVTSGASLTLANMIRQFSAGATCTFGPNALKGIAVLELNAVSNSGGTAVPDISAGLASFDGAGNVTSYSFDENNGGVLTTPSQNSYTGTYSVDPTTARVTVNLNGASTSPVWYLANANTGSNLAFVVGTDPNTTGGSFEQQVPLQSGASFSDLSIFGKYYGASITPVLPAVTNEADSVVATPAGPSGGNSTLAVTFDSNGPGGPMTNQTLSATYSVASNGRTVITDANGNTIAILYIASTGASGATSANAKNVTVNAGSDPRLTVLVH